MRTLLKIAGFTPYILVVLLNAVTDLGHKIIIQNTIFKCYSGTEQIALTAVVNGLILLPFILLFTPAGFIADRFPKDKVIKVSAALAVPLTVLITLCYHAGLFWPAFGLTFLLAMQSAFYSPAKYGYIKELTGKDQLGPANAAVQAVTIVAILAGAVLFSVLFERSLGDAALTPAQILPAIAPCGYLLIAGAAIEALTALALPKRDAGDAGLRLEAGEYVKGKYLKNNLNALRRNETILLSVIGLAIFWAVNQVLLAAFGAHLKEVAGETNTVVAQGLLSLGGLGIILGSGIAGKVSRNFIETGVIPVGALGMTASLLLLPGVESPLVLGALIMVYGACGGLVIVPLNALIQFNAPDRDTGTVLAGNNFAQNVLMLAFLAGTVLAALGNVGSVPIFYTLGAVVLGGTVYTLYKLPQSLLRVMLRLLVSQGYRLTVSGLNNIPSDGGVLLLGNHTSWIDWAVLHLAVPRRVRFVMARKFYERWYLKWFLDLFGVIPISPGGSKNALKQIAAALDNGECVALFPEGAISRNGQLGPFKRGFEEAARQAQCAIIPFYLRGLWGSAFSFATSRLRESSRLGSIRDVTISFGAPLPADVDAHMVKQAVSRLSIDAWQHYAGTFEPIHISWLRTAKRHLGAKAILDSTGAELSNRKLLATCLLASKRLGKTAGDAPNVGVLLPASAGGAIANLALLMRGKAVVNLNYTSGAEVVGRAMERAGITTVVTSRKFVTRLKAKGFDVTGVLEGKNLFHMEDLRETIRRDEFLRALLLVQFLPAWLLRLLYFKKTDVDETAAILFSSGSEGTPKGVMLSHRNIVGNVRQVAGLFNARENDTFLGTLPLFHAFGLTITTFLPLLEGIPVVCHPDPTDARGIGRLVASHGITFLCGTPTFLGMYARNRKLHPLMFASLRLVVAGAERLPGEVRTAFKAKFGLDIHEGYGTTETTPVASVNVNDVLNTTDFTVQPGRKDGTVGMPLPGSAVRIVDPETMLDLPQGEAGLILIGGTQIMKGYLHDPGRTAEAIVEQDGIRWYKTGDKGKIDEDGFIVILDRYSRFAKIGGEMVSLTAVENAMREVAPEESEIAAAAVPDPKKGERVVALVCGMDDPSALKSAMLEAGTEPIMVPSTFIGVDAIPKLGTGKTDLAGVKRAAMEFTAH